MDKHLIRMNLPNTLEEFQSGNGEGVFVWVDEETKADYDRDATGGSYIGVLDNYSYVYSGLMPGMLIRFEMRGENRPVADWNFIQDYR